MNGMRFKVLCAITSVLALSACMSARNHPALDAAQNAVNGKSDSGLPGVRSSEAFTEAYIEYPGPHAKWAGPASFVIHISTKNPHWALINVAPAWFNTSEEEQAGLTSETANKVNTKGLSSDYARERIRYLAGAMQQGPEPTFKGCLYPVRVRLIREDGTFIEKTNCRSEVGWPKVASEAAEYFLTAKLRGLSEPGAVVVPPIPEASPSLLPGGEPEQ